MPSREELRLARAKAIVQAWGWVEPWETVPNTAKQAALTAAHKVETADAAMGVVSVPVEITEEMNSAYVEAYANSAAATAWETRKEAWRAALAASPLREKPDAPGREARAGGGGRCGK